MCPRLAQVRATGHFSDSPDSSMKTMVRPSRRAFFEPGPGLALPPQDRLLVALHGALVGLLRREAQVAQQLPAAGLAVRDAELALDHRAHPLDRPQLGGKARLQRTGHEQPRQRLALRGVQPLGPAQRLGLEPAHRAVGLGQLPRPHADGLPRDTQLARHLGLRHLALEHARAGDAPRFDGLQIPLRSHARTPADVLPVQRTRVPCGCQPFIGFSIDGLAASDRWRALPCAARVAQIPLRIVRYRIVTMPSARGSAFVAARAVPSGRSTD